MRQQGGPMDQHGHTAGNSHTNSLYFNNMSRCYSFEVLTVWLKFTETSQKKFITNWCWWHRQLYGVQVLIRIYATNLCYISRRSKDSKHAPSLLFGGPDDSMMMQLPLILLPCVDTPNRGGSQCSLLQHDQQARYSPLAPHHTHQHLPFPPPLLSLPVFTPHFSLA